MKMASHQIFLIAICIALSNFVSSIAVSNVDNQLVLEPTSDLIVHTKDAQDYAPDIIESEQDQEMSMLPVPVDYFDSLSETIKYPVSYSQFTQAFTSNGYPAPTLKQYRQCMYRRARTGRITTKRELAMFLAQVMHESAGLEYKTEWGCPTDPHCQNYQYPSWESYLCGPSLDQACRNYPYAGQFYYGRGYMQLSWTLVRYIWESFNDRTTMPLHVSFTGTIDYISIQTW